MKRKSRTGSEPFTYCGNELPYDVQSFWAWGFSDLLSNSLRGVLAEYIVAQAVGVSHVPRVEWNLYDLVTTKGTTVEVKSSAYVQTWKQDRPSRITFSIRPAVGWNSESNISLKEPVRSAQVYVFCVLKHIDPDSIDVLNLDQWDFYVLATKTLDTRCPAQRTITHTRLLQLGAAKTRYEELAGAIERVAQSV